MNSRDLVDAIEMAKAQRELAERETALHTKPLAAAHVAAASKARPVAPAATEQAA